MTSDPISRLLTADHARLEALLDAATARPEAIDPLPYAEFRRGLLRHIAIEEKLLLPATQAARGGAPLAVAARLHLDHGAIAALLVPSPAPAIVATLRHVLAMHNPLEEGDRGLYAECDRLLAAQAGAIVAEIEAYPEVPVSPHNDGPRVLPAVERALARAGHQLVK
jgi:hypothetical protein